MVTYPPLAPSVLWMSNFLKALRDSGETDPAVIEANKGEISSRSWGRFSLMDDHGSMLTLSVAVEGGGRQLRSFNKINKVYLSDHGDWRKVHLGGLEAVLGAKPFFSHLIPGLRKIYQGTSLDTLEGFNTAIFREVLTFLMENISIGDLKDFESYGACTARGKEIAKTLSGDISVIQYIATIGRETLPGLLAYSTNLTGR